MTTIVTIKTADKAAMVYSSTYSGSDDGSYSCHTNIEQRVNPNSELTLSVYGNGNVSVNEENDNY